MGGLNTCSDLFTLVENSKEVGVTADEISRHTGIPRNEVANWLSKWCRRGFLKYIPPKNDEDEKRKRGRPRGRYMLGAREWGSYRHGRYDERIAVRDSVKKW